METRSAKDVYRDYLSDIRPTQRSQELRQKRAKMALEVENRIDAVIESGKGLKPGGTAQRNIDALQDQIAELENLIEAEEKNSALREHLKEPAPGVGLPNGGGFGDLNGDSIGRSTTTRTDGNPRSCRSMFGEAKNTGGFRDWTEFVGAMEAKGVDPRIDELRSMVSNVGSSAGYVVPDAFAQTILDVGLEDEVVRGRAQNWPVKHAGSIKIPAWDGEDHSSSVYGGFTASWSAEGSTNSETDAKTRQVELDPKKIIISTSVTRELEQDSIGNFAGYLHSALAKALSFNMDDRFLNGSGAGEPLGVLHSDCCIEVSKQTGQIAATTVLENYADMYGRMLPASVKRAVWVIHPSVVPGLLTLAQDIGTGGSAYPVLQDGGGLYIFNRPVIISEKCQPIGTSGDVYFADFGWYGIGIAQELAIDKSISAHWSSDKVAYRIIARVDGQPLLDSAVTPLYGSDTLSPFVRLETRS